MALPCDEEANEAIANTARNNILYQECNEKLGTVEPIKIRQLREKYLAEIEKLNQSYSATLDEKSRIIAKLTAELESISQKKCDIEEPNKMGALFLARLATRLSGLASETRSAQTILSENKLFRQYLIGSSDEYKNLVIGGQSNAASLLAQNMANELIDYPNKSAQL